MMRETGHTVLDIKIGRWRFAPNLWPSLVTLLVFPVLLLLGFWQLDRAGQKRELHKQYQARNLAEAVDLNASAGLLDSTAESLMWRQVKLIGRFDPEFQIILDNQVVHGQPGYFILAPFVITGGKGRVLVNRGWLAAAANRNVTPAISVPAEEITLQATVAPLPATGWFLGGAAIESLGAGIYRAQRIDINEIATLVKQRMPAYLLRLNPGSPHGYLREWAAPGSGEAKHLGYAFQWFALAATLMIIYLAVNVKKAV